MSARTMRGSRMKNLEGSYYKGQPDDETRQQYANVMLGEFQLTQSKLSFAEILHAFRYFGEQYDRDYRLRDKEFAA